MTPFVGHQKVEVRLGNGGDTVLKANPYVRQVKGKNFGRIKLRSKPLLEPGKYRARASKKRDRRARPAATAKSKTFSLKFIDLDPGDRGPAVELFNELLRDEGYFDTDKHQLRLAHRARGDGVPQGQRDGAQLPGRPGDLQDARRGQGRLPAAVPERRQARRGRHLQAGDGARRRRQAEVRLPHRDRRRGDAVGPGRRSPSTARTRATTRSGCTTRSTTTAARRPTATHSVPPYPASHGCIRNPIPDSVFIYNWIDLGDKMYVYA